MNNKEELMALRRLAELEDKAAATHTIEDLSNPPQESIVARSLKNLPADIKNIGAGTIQAVSHPIDTARALGDIARGGMQTALPDSITELAIKHGISPESRPAFQAFVAPLKQDFGSIEGFGEAIATHPATTLLNVQGGLSVLRNLAKAGAGSAVKTALENSVTKADIINANNELRKAAQNAGMAKGFVNSPSEANPTVLNGLLESIGGKFATKQDIQLRNAAATTGATREGLGLTPTTKLTPETFKTVIQSNYQPYRDVAALPNPPSLANGYRISQHFPPAAKDLEDLKSAQATARELWQANQRNPHPDTLAAFRDEQNKVNEIQSRFEKRALEANNPELLDKLQQARVNIAKAYTAKKATNKVTGMVDARDLGKLVEGEKPLTGPMRIAAEFEQAFPNAIRDPEHVPPPGVNQLVHAVLPAITGTAGLTLGGIPGMIAGATLGEIGPRMARNIILSPGYQRRFATIPIATPSKTLNAVNSIVNSQMSKAAKMAQIANILNQTERSKNE